MKGQERMEGEGIGRVGREWKEKVYEWLGEYDGEGISLAKNA